MVVMNIHTLSKLVENCDNLCKSLPNVTAEKKTYNSRKDFRRKMRNISAINEVNDESTDTLMSTLEELRKILPTVEKVSTVDRMLIVQK